jgi:hypothetical protein
MISKDSNDAGKFASLEFERSNRREPRDFETLDRGLNLRENADERATRWRL